ncbi:hypothetical protein MTR67_018962 [Solanum verrucosum]|uniref:Uncharacterized protein n=1 Tax=Solanum verrucosum TaxID=315347 RepID=A0AAF0QMS8_SOLVR|nr:hypothetical protein MTR67_018962 [Solanum verrucosum]
MEEEKLKKRSMEAKRAKTGDGYFSHLRYDGHSHSKFRQRFSGQGSSNALHKFNKDRVSNPKPQGGNASGSSLTSCAKCGKKHDGRCLADSNACFGCGKMEHKIRYFSSIAKNGDDNCRWVQPNPSSSPSGSQKKNIFYALQTRPYQEGSHDMVTVMVKVFQLYVYALLGTGATLYFVIPYVAMRFDILLELNEQLKDLLDKGFMRPSISPWDAQKDLNLRQRKWLELLKDFAIGVLYHLVDFTKVGVMVQKVLESSLMADVKAKQDRMMKSAHFIHIKVSYAAEDYAKVYLKEMVRLHGVPSSIISDRGT